MCKKEWGEGVEPKERTSRECHERGEREEASWRAIFVGAQTRLALDFVLCCE